MADVVRYVNTASTAGGDGTTNNTTGTDRAYATLYEWCNNEATNLVTAGDTHTVKCCGSTAETGTNVVALHSTGGGWTTNSTNWLRIEGNRDHANGFYDGDSYYSTSHYRIESDGIPGTEGWISTSDYSTNNVEYVEIDGIQLWNTGSAAVGTTYNKLIEMDSAGKITNCRFVGPNQVYTGSNSACIYISHTDVEVKNCVLTGRLYQGGLQDGITCSNAGATHTVNLINNTIYYFDRGIEITQTTNTYTVDVKNNCIFGNGDDYYVSGTNSGTVSYNASDDLDGTNTQDMSTSTPESTYWATHLTNYASGDYTVKDSGSCLYHNGVGNNTDSDVPLTDIRGNPRDYADTSIGAFAASDEVGSVFKPKMIIY